MTDTADHKKFSLVDAITNKLKVVKAKILPTHTSTRSEVRKPEYQLKEVSQALSFEGYFLRSVRKKFANVFKEGYRIHSRSASALRYLQMRLMEMHYVSGISFHETLRGIAWELIAFNNVFVRKIRNKNSASGKPVQMASGKTFDPIAALQLLPTPNVYPVVKNGIIENYVLVDNSGKELERYKPEEILHIHGPRSAGTVFAIPDVIPIIEDILALRRIEENVETLVYRHATPFIVGYVGTENNPPTIINAETKETELDVLSALIENAEPGSALILPYRYKIDVVGSKGSALDVTPYLEHFKKRVFAGLGMSAYDFGESDSANRSSGQGLSKSFIELCKDIQNTIASSVDLLFLEILLEKFPFDRALDEKVQVNLLWNELDPDRKTREENATVQLFTANIIDQREARLRIGISSDPDPDLLFTSLTGDTRLDANSASAESASKTNPTNQNSDSHGLHAIRYAALDDPLSYAEVKKKLMDLYSLPADVVDFALRTVRPLVDAWAPEHRDFALRYLIQQIMPDGEADAQN